VSYISYKIRDPHLLKIARPELLKPESRRAYNSAHGSFKGGTQWPEPAK